MAKSAGVNTADPVIDATARAIKESFDSNGLTVVRSTSNATNVHVTSTAGGALVATSDITYSWLLKDATGAITESSVTDSYQFTVGAPATAGAVSDARILPPAPEPGLRLTVPADARPASTDRRSSHPNTAKVASDRRATNGSASGGLLAAVASAPPMGYLNYANEVNYALLWTDSAHVDKMNPNYPVFSNNCANFVSQSLHAGGWAYRQGWVPSTLTNWSPDLTGPAGSSYTWGGAQHLGTFVWNTAQLPYLDNIWNALYGDLYFMDWDPNGRADGSIDHTALISGTNSAGPLVTQKSNNRHNVPLATYISIAQSQGKTNIVWYGART